MNPAEYRRMYEAEEAQWWYSGMRAISQALLEEPLRTMADGRAAPEPRRLALLHVTSGLHPEAESPMHEQEHASAADDHRRSGDVREVGVLVEGRPQSIELVGDARERCRFTLVDRDVRREHPARRVDELVSRALTLASHRRRLRRPIRIRCGKGLRT